MSRLMDSRRSVKSTMNHIIELGLVRVAKKREVEWYKCAITGQVKMVENTPRTLQLYSGIKRGRIPAGAERLGGRGAWYWYNGHKPKWQTHKLIREKFKTKKKP